MSTLKARCTICSKTIVTSKVPSHYRYIHKTNISTYACARNLCDRTFDTLTSLRRHDKKCICDESLADNDSNIVDNHFLTNMNVCESEIPVAVNNINNLNVDENINQVKRSEFAETALLTATDFYGDVSLSRSQAEKITNAFSNILKGDFMNSLRVLVLESINETSRREIETKFNDLQESFDLFNTEHKVFKVLRERQFYIEPISEIYGYRKELCKGQLETVECKGSIIPLANVFTKFFETPGVLESTLSYMKLLNSENKIFNIIQTKFWKSKIRDKNNLTLPLFLYQDACEPGNPLGSHAGIYSMSATYISIPCLPPEIRSKLENIFLFQIAHSSDVKSFSDDIVYNNVVKQLNTLEETGIEINISGQKIKMFFKLAMILGDNLGLNTILGFTSSFKADHFCRFCKISKQSSTYQTEPDESLLRNKSNYQSDLLKNNMQETGIKSKCKWNDVTDFYVTENYCVDIMHDLFEGVCNYDLGFILHNFIKIKKLFTLDDLNFKILYFQYPNGINKPPPISESHLDNKYLKMSAAEMKCFILNAPLILADLVPNKNIQLWKLLILLRQIVGITLQPAINNNDPILLGRLITKHHCLFIKLFGKVLKPKHHFMLHYAFIMMIIGPLIHIWCMRFEAKHQPIKQCALTSKNRINLPKTIAIKEQLSLSKLFLKNKKLDDNSSYEKLSGNTERPIAEISCNINDYVQIENFTYKNVKYNVNDTLKLTNADKQMYGRILNIFKSNSHDNKFAFIVKMFEVIKMDDMLQSFKLKETDQYDFILFEKLSFFELRHMVIMSGAVPYISYDNHLL